ncbi:MAG TPA: ATP-binding protein [Chloroflexota bacterium]|nr:ATP-binding protein [Chloroflexota bacterium]
MLTVYEGVLGDEIGRLFAGCQAEPEDKLARARLFHALAREAELSAERLVGNAWQDHILERIVHDENAFSLKAQRSGVEGMGSALLSTVKEDLRELQRLFQEDLGLGELKPIGEREPKAIKLALAQASDWQDMLAPLADHYREQGTGILAEHRAFRWSPLAGDVEPILNPDPIRLEDLYTYDAERELLLANTEHFLAGHPANNVLLYGERGTGKSSTVKALLQRYPRLKMVEIPPGDLADLPRLLPKLAANPGRFILFVDDLSFDEMELQYKHLKAVLEGGLETRPDNVVIYATSNRRHLVKERFSDLTKPIINDEIHQQDTVEEKLSLSDRFGITLTFITPDQERYLTIVSELTRARGLEIEAQDLRMRAIRWAMYNNGFSGRTARQFVDFLTAELAASS